MAIKASSKVEIIANTTTEGAGKTAILTIETDKVVTEVAGTGQETEIMTIETGMVAVAAKTGMVDTGTTGHQEIKP